MISTKSDPDNFEWSSAATDYRSTYWTIVSSIHSPRPSAWLTVQNLVIISLHTPLALAMIQRLTKSLRHRLTRNRRRVWDFLIIRTCDWWKRWVASCNCFVTDSLSQHSALLGWSQANCSVWPMTLLLLVLHLVAVPEQNPLSKRFTDNETWGQTNTIQLSKLLFLWF